MKTKHYRRNLLSLLVLPMFALTVCTGCPKADDKKKDAGQNVAAKQPAGHDVSPPKVVEPPPKLTMPTVELTETDAAACAIKVGDKMPNAALPDIDGKPVELHSLFGKKLSVICFWNGSQTSGLQAIAELGKYVAVPYAQKGVATIGINVDDTPQVAREKAALSGATFPMLLDPDSSYFDKVAAQTLPRIYLLDADGKVLWFDIEYSRSMRRDLLQGIDVALGK